MLNSYSTHWFESFVPGDGDERTEREVAFLVRQLPIAQFPRVLDVCCGTGRHARKLAVLGYQVTGLDRSEVALAKARHGIGNGVEFIEGDMRSLDAVAGEFDAVICMWQSFGYFDDGENARVLDAMHRKVRRDGRVILDVYDRLFVEQMAGQRRIDRGGDVINETLMLADDRLRVVLEYESQDFSEGFDWRVYTADQLIRLARENGLEPVQVAADFREDAAADGSYPRMQLVLEARTGDQSRM
jgi:SAM-dependent methyltransferase